MSRPRLVLALLAVYVIWGSTYWALAVMIRTLPPLATSGIRFVSAGVILMTLLKARGAPWPSWPEWRGAAIVGVLLLTAGNGIVAWSEQWVSSSMAAIVVSTMPLWTVVVATLWGEPSPRSDWIALALGFAGVVWMNASGELFTHGPRGLVLLLSPLTWAVGSILARRVRLPAGPMSTASEMLIGGVVLGVLGLAVGERFDRTPSTASIVAVVYLVVFGSVVALTAYGYLLRTARPAVATSYAYVNPIIAVALGMGLGNERPSAHALLGGALILAAVVLLTRGRTAPREIARDGPEAA